MTIFTKIIQGEIPSIKVLENEYALAFMDIMPLREGHILVVPKKEVDEIYNLENNDFIELNLFAKKLACAMRKVFKKRIGISVIGLEVPHAHIHLIPIESANDINFNQVKIKMETSALENIAEKIRKECENITS